MTRVFHGPSSAPWNRRMGQVSPSMSPAKRRSSSISASDAGDPDDVSFATFLLLPLK